MSPASSVAASPPSPGPHAWRLVETIDVDEARLAVSRLYAEATLEPVSRTPFGCTLDVVAGGPVKVVSGSWRGGARLIVPVMGERYTFTFVADGMAEAELAGERGTLARGRGSMLVSPARGGVISMSVGAEGRTITIERAALEAHWTALTGHALRGPIVFDRFIDETGPGMAVFEQARSFRRELARPSASPLLIAALRDAFFTSLLTNVRHSASALLDALPPEEAKDSVRRAEEYMEAYAADPITLTDVAAAVGMPVRALQAAFQARRGVTPGAFLRARRLERARRALLAALDEAPKVDAEAAGRLASLSPREREVCARVARGMLNKQIAVELAIAEPTVKAHRARAMRKLGVGSAAELARLFERLGG